MPSSQIKKFGVITLCLIVTYSALLLFFTVIFAIKRGMASNFFE